MGKLNIKRDILKWFTCKYCSHMEFRVLVLEAFFWFEYLWLLVAAQWQDRKLLFDISNNISISLFHSETIEDITCTRRPDCEAWTGNPPEMWDIWECGREMVQKWTIGWS